MAINDTGPWQIQDLFACRGVRIMPCQARLLDFLLCRQRLRLHTEIYDHLWGWDENGGPLDPGNVVKALVSKLRPQIREAGIPWEIKVYYGRGYRLIYTWLDDENLSRPHPRNDDLGPHETDRPDSHTLLRHAC